MSIRWLDSALRWLALTLNIYVGSGHGLYATGFELTVIAAVVMGGTMLSGGSGYILGTLFGVLVLGVTQTLIQFNGMLSSWWTNIVVGALTLIFIGIQSFLAARKVRAGGAAGSGKGWPIYCAAVARRCSMAVGMIVADYPA